MKRHLFSIVLCAMSLLLVAHSAVFAIGALFSRPLWSDQTYEKVWIKTVDATFQIDGQVAVTHVDQTFKNEMTTTVEAVWIFPLPEGAVVTELYYWFNGQRYKADIRERQEARNDYNNQIRQQLDPALLEYLGDNLFRLSIAPINALTDVRTEITYVQLLPYEFGSVDYSFLLNAVGMSPKPLNRVSVSGVLETPTDIKYLTSPSHGTTTTLSIAQVNEKKYQITFGDENFLPDKDLKLEYETLRQQVQVNVLRYTPVPEDSIGTDSFYAVWITPPDSIAPDQQVTKKIVFTADVSSSMEGTRIQQLKSSLMAFLDNLSSIDQFNILTFGTSVIRFKPDLVPASPEVISEARTFVTDIGAAGLTNIDEAMKQSLAQSFSEEAANMLIFITDGYPTWGETFVPNILTNVQSYNTQEVRIFPFGVGEDISKTLLAQMALENGGYATFISEDDSIAKVVSNHFKRMSKPVLKDLEIHIEGLVTSDKFPRPLQDLFWGNQVMQLGLYQNSGTYPVYLTGKIKNQQVSFLATADFSAAPGGQRFVPRLWAKEKIDYLLDQIAIYGELAELKNQVIELSMRFQILTPYTAFYSDPNDPNTSVSKENRIEQPEGFALHQNYPNPFNPATTISYELPNPGSVTVKVYDLTGRLVKVLLSGSQAAGAQSVTWDGTDFSGNPVAAGIYIYQIEFTGVDGKKYTLSKKMSLVK
jgi:Ca-activated chloride channel family protein